MQLKIKKAYELVWMTGVTNDGIEIFIRYVVACAQWHMMSMKNIK